jgi:opacity protein-like surface antigen
LVVVVMAAVLAVAAAMAVGLAAAAMAAAVTADRNGGRGDLIPNHPQFRSLHTRDDGRGWSW